MDICFTVQIPNRCHLVVSEMFLGFTEDHWLRTYESINEISIVGIPGILSSPVSHVENEFFIYKTQRCEFTWNMQFFIGCLSFLYLINCIGLMLVLL